jgi:hypothetical protein
MSGLIVGVAWLLNGVSGAEAQDMPSQTARPADPAVQVAQASETSRAPGTDDRSRVQVIAAPPVDPNWRVTVVPYLWMAGVKSSLSFSPPIGSHSSIDANVDASFTDILRRLDAVFMGAAEARRGPFSAQTDIIYLAMSEPGSRVSSVTGPRGREFPFSLGGKLKLRTTIWTLTGGYDVYRTDRSTLQLFAGFRYLGANATLDWFFQGPVADVPRTGQVKQGADLWDGIAGARGEVALGDTRWKLVYYGDAGAGGSKLTWQASAQLAYAARWGDVGIGWRYLDYQQNSGKLIQDLRMSGPILIARYRFGG